MNNLTTNIYMLLEPDENPRAISARMLVLSVDEWIQIFSLENIPDHLTNHIKKYFKVTNNKNLVLKIDKVREYFNNIEEKSELLDLAIDRLSKNIKINKPVLFRGVSLFANVGIAEALLDDTGVKIVVANELLKDRARFYQENNSDCNMIQGDITNERVYKSVIELARKARCNFLLATPPCQGHSVAGRMKEDDPRNSLIISAVHAIVDLEPENAMIENVVGMLKSYITVDGEKIKILDFIDEQLKPLGYFINPVVANAASHGTAQSRRRAFLLISKIAMWEVPAPNEMITVRDAIGHLPSLESGERSDIEYHHAKLHNDRHILFMRHTPSGKSAFENEVHFPKREDGVRVSGFSQHIRELNGIDLLQR